MKITVVVPILNEERSIGSLLDGLRRQTRPADEIILVDGGSTDETVRLVLDAVQHDPTLQLLQEPQAWPGRGRNIGARAARHEWLAFIDAGVSPAPGWLQKLADAVTAAPTAEVVYGRWEPVTDTLFKECAAIAYGKVPSEEVDEVFRQSRAVFSSLMRREVWQSVGGFPEDLRSAEDLLFIQKIDEAGVEIAYAPAAVVRWTVQPDLWRTFRRFLTYSRHNMRAGLWRQWQASVLMRYALILVATAIAFGLTRWWWVVPIALWLGMLGTLSLVALYRNRQRYAAGPTRHLLRFFVLVPLLATIDAATIVGVITWSILDKLASRTLNFEL